MKGRRRTQAERMIGILLCMVMAAASWLPVRAGASQASPSPTLAEAEAAGEDYGILDPEELTKMLENFLGERGISSKNFSLGFCYTATGDTWYYNGDAWFYPASMYKVPLMMLLSEKVKSGELTQDSDIEGKTVAEIEELILVYSNNDWAHNIRSYLGGDDVWREQAKQYATLKDTEYDPDYMQYCYFSNRYMTEVVKTLYNESDRFPNILESMKVAEATHYYRLSMEGIYDIAQKYGSYCDQMGHNFNNNTGVIYTPHPFILTVMTLDVGDYEKVISDAAVMMKNYVLKLDNKLGEYERAIAKAEADRLEAERAAALAEEQAKADAERQRAEQEAAAKAIAEQQALQQARSELFTKLIILAAVIVAAALLTLIILRTRKKKQRQERYDTYRKRYEAEQRSRSARGESGRSESRGGYRPRH